MGDTSADTRTSTGEHTMRTIRIVATIEFVDGTVQYKTWTNRDGKSSVSAMKRRIRAHYATNSKVVHVGLGNALVTNSYGAH